ncbi:hypothetical protein WJX77_008845 [Trebouxia sp. C0004]
MPASQDVEAGESLQGPMRQDLQADHQLSHPVGCMKPAEEEEDVLDALGTLASFASQQQNTQEEDQDMEAGDDDDDDQPFTRKPFTRTMQKQERDALQKWVQCAKCAKWRKVPFTLKDEDISEDWECKDNKWDRMYAACTMAQALTDEEIDGILAGQQDALEARPLPPVEHETAEADNTDSLQPEASKQNPNRSRPSRNKTKKVIGGATDEEIAEHAARPRPTRPAAVRHLQRTRPKSKNGKMRAGKNINDAAEALLGMGSGFVDDDLMGDDDGDENGEDGDGSAFSSGSFRPGKVVWAKVDGHEWWPAKVVRRRAVPREVGPPPGGPTLVHTQIPVVFFTQSGVPGEVTDILASSHGPVYVCTQAMAHIGSDSRLESEEAEYAWLSIDSLKPFREGDSLAFEEDKHISDPTLKACIAAAEHAVKTAADRAAAAAADAELEGEDVDDDSQSDSDGGWGYTHVDALGTPGGAQRGRQRPAKPRKGRALKGNKRAKGKSGRAGWDDEDDIAASEVPLVDPYGRVPGVPLAAPVVEGLYGWRWPLSQQNFDREFRSEDVEIPHEQGQDQGPAKTQNSNAASGGLAGDAQHDGLQQEEADAVAALLAAASGLSSEDMNASTPYPSGSEKEAEYLVKWIGKAHIHNEWVPEPLLLRIAKRKVINFKRRYGSQPCTLTEPAWTQPCRFICRRPCLSGPGWEVLVKWCDLGYEHATWEVEGEGELVQAHNQKLHRELWQRQREALLRSQPEAAEAAAAAKEAAMTHMPSMTDHPAWIQQGQLYPHQLQAVGWMREQWVQGLNAVLADEKGLGRTATVITFLQCLRNEFHCPGPVLIAMQASELKKWESEWEFWGGQGLHVVSFSGSAAARTVIHEHELWLSPGCLDGKAPKRLKGDLANKVVQPDVVLVTYDALTSDISQLQPIEWEAIVVDERNRIQPSLSKALQVLRELDANFRLLLASGNPTKASYETLVQSLQFVEEAVPEQAQDSAAQQQHQDEMSKALHAHMLRRTRSEVSSFAPPRAEVVLPVMMTQRQRECYKAHLARAYEVLTDPKTPRQNSHRGGQLRAVCASLKKVCDHPFLLADSDQAGSGAADAVSGKLVVLGKLLRHLHSNNHKVLLLSHHPKVLRIVAAQCRQQLPSYPLEHIEACASTATCHAAIERYNADSTGVLLMNTRSCGLGTNLPSVNTIIIYDSDWNPRWDVQALSMAHCIGSADRAPTVYRLVTKGTLEERVHQLTDKKKGCDLVFKSSHSKSSPAAVHMMEDALKWGVEYIFSRHRYHTEHVTDADFHKAHPPRPASASTPASSPGDIKMEEAASPRSSHQTQEAVTPAAAAAAEAAASPDGTPPASASPEPGMQSPFGAPEQQQQPQQQHRSRPKIRGSFKNGSPVFQPVYTDSVVDKLVQWSMSLPGMHARAQPSPEAVTDQAVHDADGHKAADEGVQSAGEVLGAGWECVKLQEWSQAQLDNDVHGDDGEDEDAIEDTDCPDLSPHGEGSPARGEPSSSSSSAKFWEALLKEKHEQLLKEEEQEQVREQWQTSHLRHVDTSPALDAAEEAGTNEYAEEAEEEEGLGPRQSSGLSHLEYGADDNEAHKVRKNRRQIQASGRAVGKTNRRRRLDEEDEQAEEARATRKRKRGPHQETGRPTVERAEVEALQHEWRHQEDIMQRIADASTPEGHVADKAYRRISELVDELKLDEGHTELAHQTAEILMMLRPEGEAASDFQDYTLVAVIAVAAHLCGSHVGDHHFIAALAQRFSQDSSALQQVFEYILSTVARFRHSHTRMMSILGEHVMSHGGTYSTGLPEGQSRQAGEHIVVRVDSERPSSAEHHHAVAQPPSVIMNSDMEAFGNRLNAIVNADFYAAALAVGPVDVPLGPLQALSAHLPADNSAQAAHTEEILKQLRQMQEQVALFDRIHNIRVKHIQEEYQKYMERVRSKAQSAIDQANANYQHHRAMLTARVDAMVHYLQQQYLRGPTSGVYQADRLQQLQQQQQQLHQQQQQQQHQQQPQQRSVDSEALQLNALSSASISAAEADVNPAFLQASQDVAGEQEAGNQSGSQPAQNKLADDLRDQLPAATRGNAGQKQAPKPPLAPGSKSVPQASSPGGDWMSVTGRPVSQSPHQPPFPPGTSPSHYALHQAAPPAAQTANSHAVTSPYHSNQSYLPQSQHMLLARQLTQPSSHLPLKGLSPQQQSQVLNQYNHDQQRATAPMQAVRRAGPVVLAGHPTREAPGQTVHAIFQQGGAQQSAQKSKLGSGAASPTPLASLVTSQPHPHPYPHGITVQSGAPSMVPPSHPKPIQTGPSGDSFPTSRASELAQHSSQQPKAFRDGIPKRAATDARISADPAGNAVERPSPPPSSALGAASYGALTMGITVQPSASLPPLGAHSDDDSMGESSPSRSPSPAKEALTAASQPAVAVQTPSNAFAAASALPVQQSAVSPRRVSMLRGSPVAGSYIDGRQVTTGSGELPSHIGYEADERYGRAAAMRKAEAARYASLGSGKADSGPGRSMHASPARLIITSGASVPSSRDDAMAHAVSGSMRSETAQTPAAAQMAAAYNQQYGMALPQQHGHATRSAEQSHAHLAPAAGPQMLESLFPSRVDSLSGWARQSEAQQRSNSPQSSGYAGSQPRGSCDFEQGRYVHRAGDQET